MGSSDEPGSNAREIDGSVGGLVWVRRRNGSWWPGRILGPDEVADGSLVSPRIGTPVKLLGREDASVDWYNLEKSKRVKAFRCGEYDDCIEKARANLATGNKKAVKYARREDAILHALEIENDRLAKDHINISLSNNSRGDLKKNKDSRSDSDSDSDSLLELSQSGLSFEEPARVGGSRVQYVQGKRRRTPNDSEDDGTEKIKRMRGLDDLGMAVGDLNCWSNGSQSNGIKRKRSQNGQEFLKRKDRRRTLTKVLESTAVISIPVICDQVNNLNGSPLQGLSGIESNDSRRSVSLVANNNSDSTGVSDKLFNVPFVGDEKISTGFSPVIASTSTTRHKAYESGRQYNQHNQTENDSLRNPRMERSPSKWQSKGKRNSRHKVNNRKHEKIKYISLDDNPDPNKPLTSFNYNSSVKSEQFVASDFLGRTITESNLYEVKLEVKANYEPQKVPLVSLTSKLNGKPIIGRPLPVDLIVCNQSNSYRPIRIPTKVSRVKRRLSRGKSKRRRTGILCKKIRKLSSLTSNGEKVKGGVIECVPVKVVFSRISEALNGQMKCGLGSNGS